MKRTLRDLGLIFSAASRGPYGAFATILETRGPALHAAALAPAPPLSPDPPAASSQLARTGS